MQNENELGKWFSVQRNNPKKSTEEILRAQNERDNRAMIAHWQRNLDQLKPYRDHEIVALKETSEGFHASHRIYRVRVGPARRYAQHFLDKAKADAKELRLDYHMELQATEWFVLKDADPYRYPKLGFR